MRLRVLMLLALVTLGAASCAISPGRAYLVAMRKKINASWSYPCDQSLVSSGCDYKDADLTLEFHINPDGQLISVEVLKSSGFGIYDDNAINAVKLAAPFGSMPDELKLKALDRPFRIRAHFKYVANNKTPTLDEQNH